jgi:hypothetical protein
VILILAGEGGSGSQSADANKWSVQERVVGTKAKGLFGFGLPETTWRRPKSPLVILLIPLLCSSTVAMVNEAVVRCVGTCARYEVGSYRP